MKRLLIVAATVVAGSVAASPAQQGGGTLPVTVPQLPTFDEVAPPPGWRRSGSAFERAASVSCFSRRTESNAAGLLSDAGEASASLT